MHRTLNVAAALLALILAPAACSRAAQNAEPPPKKIRTADCVYVPTPNDVVEKMLEMAGVKKTDLLYDLGSGDGRIVVAAARKYGCKAVGYEIDPERVADARKNIKKRNVEKLAKVVQEDVFKLDLSPASVITIYLLPEMEVKLLPQLKKLKDGSRIVVHDYPIRGIKAQKEATMTSKEDNVEHHVYLYTLPLKEDSSAGTEYDQ
jgi:protein-L-isoaspartate O-methyltransferase